MSEKIKRIGILTGGGDCPGLNAVIRASVKTAFHFGWEVVGIRKGFAGLIKPGLAKKIGPKDIVGILNQGGTILGTSNRDNPFEYRVKVGKQITTKDVSDQVVKNFKKLNIDALVVIGGDGTLKIAKQFYDKGIPLIGVPKTIDNDLSATVITFGFDTAVSTATDAIDKLHSTAESHERAMVVEVMGRYAGWIALNSGVSGGADVILIPEIPFSMDAVCEKIKLRDKNKRKFSIIVVAEGATPIGGSIMTKGEKELGREVRLGGIGQWVSDEITRRIGKESRAIVLGHLQRGGNPTTFDRLVGTRFGAAAIRLLKQGEFGKMVALDPPNIKAVPLEKAIGSMKRVPLDSDVIQSARDMGIYFGDEKVN